MSVCSVSVAPPTWPRASCMSRSPTTPPSTGAHADAGTRSPPPSPQPTGSSSTTARQYPSPRRSGTGGSRAARTTGSTSAVSAGPAHGLPARSPPDGHGMITDEHAISRSGHPGPAARPHPTETGGHAPAGSRACEPYSRTLPYDALPGETKTVAAASQDARRGSEYLESVRYPPAGGQPGFHPLHTAVSGADGPVFTRRRHPSSGLTLGSGRC